jgi:hypothetical protein
MPDRVDVTPIFGLDRIVHGRSVDGAEIVRYDRSGKWRLERPDGLCLNLTLAWAVRHATQDGGEAYLGKPGGRAFDAAVRRAETSPR